MKLTKGQWFVVLFSLLYLLAFTAYYIYIKNYEFLWYIAVLVFFFLLILFTIKKSKFSNMLLWGLSIWGLFHMAGGCIIINGDVLYRLILIPIVQTADISILKFDQFVHAYGFAIATLVAYHLIKPYFNEKTNYKVVYPLLIAIGMGLGALNEIVEFIAVVIVPETGVGGYFNTSLDMVFNTIGAVIAVVFIHLKRKNDTPRPKGRGIN